MALPSTAGGLAAAIDHMPDRRHEGGSECVLDHGRGEERPDPDQPCLLDAEFHAKREPRKSGRKNDDVAKSHRHEKPRHAAIPPTLPQPSRDEARDTETEKIPAARPPQRRRARDRTA